MPQPDIAKIAMCLWEGLEDLGPEDSRPVLGDEKVILRERREAIKAEEASFAASYLAQEIDEQLDLKMILDYLDAITYKKYHKLVRYATIGTQGEGAGKAYTLRAEFEELTGAGNAVTKATAQIEAAKNLMIIAIKQNQDQMFEIKGATKEEKLKFVEDLYEAQMEEHLAVPNYNGQILELCKDRALQKQPTYTFQFAGMSPNQSHIAVCHLPDGETLTSIVKGSKKDAKANVARKAAHYLKRWLKEMDDELGDDDVTEAPNSNAGSGFAKVGQFNWGNAIARFGERLKEKKVNEFIENNLEE
ncbi:unnamed protein product, partial [Mesorhabditis spiculigera]